MRNKTKLLLKDFMPFIKFSLVFLSVLSVLLFILGLMLSMDNYI